MADIIKNENLEEVNGGSWFITEAEGKAAGLTLKNEDGSAGSWGYLWKTGDYWWNDQKLSREEANAIVHYCKTYGHQPDSLETAMKYVK